MKSLMAWPLLQYVAATLGEFTQWASQFRSLAVLRSLVCVCSLFGKARKVVLDPDAAARESLSGRDDLHGL